MSKVSEIYGQMKTVEELQAFAEAQHNTINQLTEQLKQADSKNKHLEDMVSGSVPLLNQPSSTSPIYNSEEEYIAREQLKMFAQTASEREFTLEETRKIDIYAKLLMALNLQEKKPRSELDGKSPAELLKLVEDSGSV